MPFNIYCDESCHLEADQSPMVLGAVWCSLDSVRTISQSLRAIKVRHGINPKSEWKWAKISPNHLDMYMEAIEYFFAETSLHFRCLIAPKNKLDHKAYDQTHDSWYYKMYFGMHKTLLDPKSTYRVYLDIKDTRGGRKVRNLHEVLCNDLYDFSKSIIESVQVIRSDESEIMQLADILIGSVSYTNRALASSSAKMQIIESVKRHSGYTLVKTTLLREEKFNIFRWQPQEKN